MMVSASRELSSLQAAWNRFQWADPSAPDAIDAAIYELCAAERRVGIGLREAREKERERRQLRLPVG